MTSGLLSGKKTARRPDRFFYFLSPDLSSFLVSLHIVVEAYRVLSPSLLPPPHKRQRIGRLSPKTFVEKLILYSCRCRVLAAKYTVYTHILYFAHVLPMRVYFPTRITVKTGSPPLYFSSTRKCEQPGSRGRKCHAVYSSFVRSPVLSISRSVTHGQRRTFRFSRDVDEVVSMWMIMKTGGIRPRNPKTVAASAEKDAKNRKWAGKEAVLNLIEEKTRSNGHFKGKEPWTAW